MLKNALNSIQDAGKISIKSSVSGDLVRVKVRDSGGGIGDEESERIFEPFFTTRDEGTGLGLAIAREIVEAHGGRIYFESEKNEGATFFVELLRAAEK